MYVTPNTPQPTYVHSGAGEQFAAWSAVSMGDLLEVVDDPAQAQAKLGQPGQWIQVRDLQGHAGWIDATKFDQAYFGALAQGPLPPRPASPVAPQPFTPAQPPVQPVQSPPQQPIPIVQPVQPAQPILPPLPAQPVAPGSGIFVHTTLGNGQWIRAAQDLQAASKDDVTSADKMEALGDPGTILTKLGKYPEWIQVRTPRGVVGWAAAWYLERFPEYFVWSEGHALAGLHGSTESWADRWDEQAFQIIQDARIEAVKMIASNNLSQQPQMLANIISRLHWTNVRFIMARLLAKFETPRTPQDFVAEISPDAQALYNLGVRYFEVHNEPNLHIIPGSPEGMWVAWQNGAQFGEFFQQVVALMKPTMPDAKFGFPGLSPNSEVPKQIYSAETFLKEADPVIQDCDFLCMHTYWGPGGSDYMSSVRAIDAMCKKYPNKLILVSEFANSNPAVSKDVKGREYALFYSEVRKLPSNLGGVFAYALTSAGNEPDRMWAGSSIPQLVGQRSLG